MTVEAISSGRVSVDRDDVPFVLVDVFAQQPLTGNPLALVPHADALDVVQMRAIAREFNQSETTFIITPTRSDVDWRLRSFTAAGFEVLGAGHNAMGAWIWLAASGLLDESRSRFRQQIGEDVLVVDIDRGDGTGALLVTMEQSAPQFGATVDDVEELAAALGLNVGDLAGTDAAQVVSTGVGHLLIQVVNRDAVDRAKPEPSRLLAVLRASGGEGAYVYAVDAEPRPTAAYARFFNPTVGIVEDPATGTAAGPLVARIVRAGHVDDGVPAFVEQGTAVGRPSLLQVTVTGARVQLSGTGVVVATGNLHLVAP